MREIPQGSVYNQNMLMLSILQGTKSSDLHIFDSTLVDVSEIMMHQNNNM